MPFSRYNKEKVFQNSSEAYSEMLNKKKLGTINTVFQKKMNNFSSDIASKLTLEPHIWAVTDKIYNVSNKFYGSPDFWWLILWANNKMSVFEIEIGEIIYIPLSLEKTISLVFEE